MRILFICNYSLLYGANRSLLTLLDGLKDKGYEIMVLLPSNGPIVNELKYKDINYKVIPYFSSYLYIKFLYKHLLVPILFFYNFLILPKLLREAKIFKPDIIYSNTSAENLGIVLSKLLKIKHITHIREFMSLDHGSYFLLGRNFKRKFINMSDGVIFVSESVAEHVLINSELNDKHAIIYNGIKTNKELIINDELPKKIRFGSVGVLQPSKGHHILLDYFNQFSKKYPTSELHIFGEGWNFYERKLRKIIVNSNLENKVFLHGFVKNTSDIYSKIDALCMFSRSEGFGRVTVEAMSRGIPVIGLNNGGTKELIQNGVTGFLINDYNSFENSVLKLFSQKNNYNNFRRQSYLHALNNFSTEKYVENIENFILRVSSQQDKL